MQSVHPGLFSHECNAKMLDQYLFMIHATVKPVALYLHCVRKSNLIRAHTTFSNPGVGRLEIYAIDHLCYSWQWHADVMCSHLEV